MSGPELVRRMRQHDPELRAIFVSGYKNDADVYTVDGAVDFIAKPFSVNVLIERLQAMQSEQPLPKAVAAG
ncbi:MAG: response regulator, partial [Terricaulis sp.]